VFLVMFDLVLCCGVIVVSPFVGCCNNLNELLDPFLFSVAAEQKGGHG